jgi:hypothetical protein
MPSSKRISTTSGFGRLVERLRPEVDVCRRLLPRVLEHAGLDRASPEVLVDRVRECSFDWRTVMPCSARTRAPRRARPSARAWCRRCGCPAPASARPRPAAPGRCPCRCSRARRRRRRGRAPCPRAASRSAAGRAPSPAGSGPRRPRRPAAPGRRSSAGSRPARRRPRPTRRRPASRGADAVLVGEVPEVDRQAVDLVAALRAQPVRGDGGVQPARVCEDDLAVGRGRVGHGEVCSIEVRARVADVVRHRASVAGPRECAW